MHRWLLLAAATIAIAACGGDGDGTTTSSPATETTAASITTSTAPETTAGPTTETTSTVAETTSTTAAVDTTSTTTTTTTTTAPSVGSLAITRVVFEPSAYVVITNVGGDEAELGAHWLCKFPAYQQLPAQTLLSGDSVAIGLDAETPPDLLDFVAVFELGSVLGAMGPADGEIALFTAANFGSPDAMVDYVEWGFSGHQRSSVAVAAGIWSDGAFIEIPEEALAISSSGALGGNESDWFVDIGG